MPVRLLYEWMAYRRLNPWGEWRADWRAGMQAAVLVNLFAGKKAGVKKPEDYMPKFRGRKRMTAREIYETMKMGLTLGWGMKKKEE